LLLHRAANDAKHPRVTLHLSFLPVSVFLSVAHAGSCLHALRPTEKKSAPEGAS